MTYLHPNYFLTGNRKARKSFDISNNIITTSSSSSASNDHGNDHDGGSGDINGLKNQNNVMKASEGDGKLDVSMAEAVATAVRTVENSEIRREAKVVGKIESGMGVGIRSTIVDGIGMRMGIGNTTGGGMDEVGVRFFTSMSLDSDDGSASPEALEVTHFTT